LTARPSAADAAFAEGAAAYQAGRPSEAESAFRRALAADPKHWRARYLLGIALHQQGRNGQAAEALRRAVELQPANAEIAANLGVVLRAAGKFPEAVAAFRRALELAPRLAAVARQLAAALYQMGDVEGSERAARAALALEPDDAEGLTTLATALEAKRAFAEAETHFKAALRRAPDLPEAHNGLGAVLQAQGRTKEALVYLTRAVALRPGFAQASVNLSAALADDQRPAEAVAAARRAIAAMPDLAEAHSNLGNALKDLGEIKEAIVAFRRALALKPDLAAAHSNLIFALDFDPDVPWSEALAERRRWNERFAMPLTRAAPPPATAPDPERRLRVGYVSADFRRHSAALVIAPPILAHDPEVVEVVCYSSVRAPDDMTAEFAAKAALWRDVAALDDGELAALIREDRIDVLVDLSAHSGGHRLLAFARRPAPIQITAWGYAAGAGIDAIDWIVTDDTVAPPGETPFHEKPLRLPAYLCFRPPPDAPDIAERDAAAPVVFGSFNRIAKLGQVDIAAQARILAEVPGARLVFKDKAFDDPATRQRFARAFADRGIDAARLDFLGASDHRGHLAAYGRVDLALDPLNYGGGVSTMEALWMGVPVLTRRGDRPSLRGAASILSAMSFPELIAADVEDYVARAGHLAHGIAAWRERRRDLRPRLAACPHMNAASYARAVEAAYRGLWRDWCAGRNVSMVDSS
jgi:predicted O-linked N-acetylglucosamine transferase (SPINDLY family)